MDRYRVDISEPAENDLIAMIRYINTQLNAPITAEKTLDAIVGLISNLDNMPQRIPMVSDERLSAMGYHKLVYKNYIIFFTIDEEKKVVDIERILYGRRDWRGLI